MSSHEEKKREYDITYDKYLSESIFMYLEDDTKGAGDFRAQYPEYAAREASEIETRKEEKAERAALRTIEDAKRSPDKVVIIDGKFEIGTIISCENHQYRVTESFYLSAKEVAELEDTFDSFLLSGRYSRAILIDNPKED